MSQHTPGEWRLDYDDETSVVVDTDEYEMTVADCSYSTFIPDDQKIANARLIAKAPEMLELLEKLIQTAQSGPVAIGLLVGEAKSIIAETALGDTPEDAIEVACERAVKEYGGTMKPKKREYWTIVMSDGVPVVPFDCNGHHDQGMLVYRSKRAATSACKHQRSMYSVACKPCELGKEADYEDVR